MDKKDKKLFIIGGSLFLLFILYTISLTFVDVKPIGPLSSSVAYASINGAIHDLTGVNWTLYNITDWAGIPPILLAGGFAVLGLVQLIKRKSIKRVDSNIIALGVFYVVVFATFIFFEFVIVNYRPVLVEGRLEASYPSSTTMLATCILPTAIIQFNKMIKKENVKLTLLAVFSFYTAFLVVGRIVSGVHWLTDILGGLLFSSAVIILFIAFDKYLDSKLVRE